MAKTCNFYLDKGSDFQGFIQITGINNLPIDISRFDFTSQMVFIRNCRFKVDIKVTKYKPKDGIICLTIPYDQTDKLPVGDWRYDIEMYYKNIAPQCNKRSRILQGTIVVVPQVTTVW